MEMAISSATLTLSCTPIPRLTAQSLSFSSSNTTALFTQETRSTRSLVLGRTRTRTRTRTNRGLSCNCLFGLGMPELVVIAGVAALVFGPKKLPEVGRSIGKTVKSFQQAAKEFESELKKEPNSATEPPVDKAMTVSEEEKPEVKVSSAKEN